MNLKFTLKAGLRTLVVLMLFVSSNVFGQSGIYESYAVLNINGAGNTFYDMQAITGNPDLQGANLGTFTIGAGNSLVIAGGENKTYKCAPCDITNGNLWYRVWSGTPSGSFTNVSLNFNSNLGTGCGGNDQKWQTLSGSTNILTGLTAGNYTLEIYSTADYTGCGTGTNYSSNGGANYQATFTVDCPTINLSALTTDPTCAGGTFDGSIDLSVSGGTPLTAPVTQNYAQDFNTLASAGASNTWSDNTTIAGWYSNRIIYIASTGTSTTGGLYSFGTVAADRAIGSLGSSSATPIHYGVAITNTTGETINSVNVVYTGEQWRCGGTTSVANTLDFTYQLNAASISTGTWTDVNTLDFTSPIVSGTAAALDGNLAANRINFNQNITVSILPGQTIWLRWTDLDNSSSDHGLAVDDLTVTLNGTTSYYLYSWDNGATTQDIASLGEGSYNVTVTDANGCTAVNGYGIVLTGTNFYYSDVDADGYGDPLNFTSGCSAPGGYVLDDTDCDDTNDAINPGETEICNEIDDNCDGNIDEGVLITFYADNDSDGFGNAAEPTMACTAPVNFVADNTDCDDSQLLYADGDGDGVGAGDPTACGVTTNTDCNDDDISAFELNTYYQDLDLDNFGSDITGEFCASSAPTGYADMSGDCNDGNNDIYPGATEVCNLIDDNCDGFIDEGFPVNTYYADAEGDGFGDAGSTISACTAPPGYVDNNLDCQPLFITYTDADGDYFGFGAPVPCGPVINNVDCDDTQLLYSDSDSDGYGAGPAVECGVPTNTDCAPFNSAINPGAEEICNGIDEDCDGTADNGVTLTYYVDADNDGYGAGDAMAFCTDPGTGYSINDADCDDADENINPGETEICNGLDDDCSGVHDDGPVVFLDYYVDADADGYGQGAAFGFCEAPVSGWSLTNGDCDDGNENINPGETEICNGLDDDCSGVHDDGPVVFLDYYVDADADGYGQGAAFGFCEAPVSGWSLTNGDCDDGNENINPGETEICNGLDDDCSGVHDDGPVVFLDYYVDADADGYGQGAAFGFCEAPVSGWSLTNGDCDDGNENINPGETEICNGLDDDCSGVHDDGPVVFLDYYVDADADGYGQGAAFGFCEAPVSGWSLTNGDCDDGNENINPGETEICNGLDDDCSGVHDDGPVVFLDYYVDADADGYGQGAAFGFCEAPVSGWSLTNGDCDDGDDAINPGETEICNAVDDDCSGTADDGLIFVTYYKDNDNDGYGNETYGTVSTCDGAPATYVADNTDCEDFDNTINPAAIEICNFIDDNCSGIADEGLPIFTFYLDADGDTYGSPFATLEACGPYGVMWVENSEDCDDADADVHPGLIDECNGIDNDCDGNIDDNALFTTYYLDNDADSYGDYLDAGTTFCYVPAAPYVLDNTDCNDANNTAYPGAAELCDGVDNDCDGSTDEDLVTASISPAGPTTLCKGDFVELTANAGPGYIYQWYKNGNLIPGATSITYTTNKSGYFQVEVSLPGGCNVLSATHGISVIAKPNANISAPNGTSLCASVKLKASYGGGYSWQWYLDGSPIPGANDYLYFPTVAGSYACRVTNASGCSRNTPSIAVTACKEGEIVDGAVIETFDIYPNPTVGEFVIDLTLNTTATTADMQLLNIMGEIVYSNSISVNNGSINESIQLNDNVPSGMYIVKVIVDGIEHTQQLILQQ